MPNVKKEDNCITVVKVRKINSIMWNLFLKPNNFMLSCWNLSQGLYLMSVSNNLCMWWVCLSLLWACLRCPRQRSWNYFVSTQIHNETQIQNANTNTKWKHNDIYTNDKCLSLDQLELFRLTFPKTPQLTVRPIRPESKQLQNIFWLLRPWLKTFVHNKYTENTKYWMFPVFVGMILCDRKSTAKHQPKLSDPHCLRIVLTRI